MISAFTVKISIFTKRPVILSLYKTKNIIEDYGPFISNSISLNDNVGLTLLQIVPSVM